MSNRPPGAAIRAPGFDGLKSVVVGESVFEFEFVLAAACSARESRLPAAHRDPVPENRQPHTNTNTNTDSNTHTTTSTLRCWTTPSVCNIADEMTPAGAVVSRAGGVFSG